MARVIINGEPVQIENETKKKISDVVPIPNDAASVLVTNTDGSIEMISSEQAKQSNLKDVNSLDVSFVDVEKGSSKRAIEYLSKEMPFIVNFLDSFVSNNGEEVSISIDDETGVAFLSIFNFPLPDSFGLHDTEDIVMALPNYPDTPPIGIYLKKDSLNKLKIINALSGHVYDNTIITNGNCYDDLDKIADWVCFHYKGNVWHYNYNKPNEGDCIYKYLKMLWSKLNENKKI